MVAQPGWPVIPILCRKILTTLRDQGNKLRLRLDDLQRQETEATAELYDAMVNVLHKGVANEAQHETKVKSDQVQQQTNDEQETKVDVEFDSNEFRAISWELGHYEFFDPPHDMQLSIRSLETTILPPV